MLRSGSRIGLLTGWLSHSTEADVDTLTTLCRVALVGESHNSALTRDISRWPHASTELLELLLTSPDATTRSHVVSHENLKPAARLAHVDVERDKDVLFLLAIHGDTATHRKIISLLRRGPSGTNLLHAISGSEQLQVETARALLHLGQEWAAHYKTLHKTDRAAELRRHLCDMLSDHPHFYFELVDAISDIEILSQFAGVDTNEAGRAHLTQCGEALLTETRGWTSEEVKLALALIKRTDLAAALRLAVAEQLRVRYAGYSLQEAVTQALTQLRGVNPLTVTSEHYTLACTSDDDNVLQSLLDVTTSSDIVWLIARNPKAGAQIVLAAWDRGGRNVDELGELFTVHRDHIETVVLLFQQGGPAMVTLLPPPERGAVLGEVLDSFRRSGQHRPGFKLKQWEQAMNDWDDTLVGEMGWPAVQALNSYYPRLQRYSIDALTTLTPAAAHVWWSLEEGFTGTAAELFATVSGIATEAGDKHADATCADAPTVSPMTESGDRSCAAS